MKIPAFVTSTPTKASLHTWNIWLAGFHAVQAIAVLLISVTKTFPISVSYLTIDPLKSDVAKQTVLAPASHHLFDLNLAYLVATFFLLSAIAHTLMATVYRKRYEVDLDNGINYLRWFEYALSASVMLVGIGLLVGMYDGVSLGLLFVLCAVMNLLGLVMEKSNTIRQKSVVNWSSYIVGCIAGIAPWLAIAAYLISTTVYGAGQIPTFVYWIFVSIFIFFSSFAVNMWLQYNKIGPWKNYLYGERSYMLLSLLAKSLLAWQVFAGALQP